jgi:carbonic anhydrase
MAPVETLFKNNEHWSLLMKKRDPRYFSRLVRIQKPEYLWIGCSDSRVPANEITGLMPGELFVHRNIANIVYLDDLNCVSVIRYAVDILKVNHIIVCGHYNCAGIKAALESRKLGKIDLWLKDIRHTMRENILSLNKIKAKKRKIDFLCELNVIRQVQKITRLKCVAHAMKGKRCLRVHAWIYDLNNGLIKDLLK